MATSTGKTQEKEDYGSFLLENARRLGLKPEGVKTIPQFGTVRKFSTNGNMFAVVKCTTGECFIISRGVSRESLNSIRLCAIALYHKLHEADASHGAFAVAANSVDVRSAAQVPGFLD